MAKPEYPIKDMETAQIGAETEKPLRDAGRITGVPLDTKQRLDAAADVAADIAISAYQPEKNIIGQARENEKNRYIEAQKLFGGKFLGVERVQEIFGEKGRFDLRGLEVPALPPTQKLEKGKELGAALVLRVYESKRPAEWKLFLPTVLEETYIKDRYQDYIGQTRAVRDFLAKNELMTEEEAASCTEEKLKQLEDLVKSDPVNATVELTELKINQNHRHSVDTIKYLRDIVKGTAIEFDTDDFEVTKDPVRGHALVYTVGKFTDPRAHNRNEQQIDKPGIVGWDKAYKWGVRVVL